MRVKRSLVALSLLASACGSTTDYLGDGRLGPLHGPASYPNAFKDLLGKSDAEIELKLSSAFEQLFHGDPNTEAIYAADGADQAVINDVLHADQRTEGFGLAMLIAVQLDHRDEFDRLWRGVQRFRYTSGPFAGYFYSNCDSASGTRMCVDPYGLQQLVMALVLARGRWQAEARTIDYAAEAYQLIYLMRYTVERNGGVATTAVDSFDPKTKLVLDEPKAELQNQTRPSLGMPAYYALWGRATGDAFLEAAAVATRKYLSLVSNTNTGLTPVRATLDGKPVADSDSFQPESYRVQINLALDHIWVGPSAVDVELSNRLLKFFSGQGESYGSSFTLEGSVLNVAHEPALVSVNGFSALISSNADRADYVSAVWNQALSVGPARYYSGLLQMLALLALSGRLRVY
ncbi:MAG: glycosyl hydrolase family 8 [Polyangiaceae bacterium]